MKITRNTALLVILSVLAAGSAIAQADRVSGTGKFTFDQLVAAAKVYFRDTAEFPLLQTMTFSVVDSKGRARKPKVLTTDYIFHGYSRQREKASGEGRGNISFWAMLGGAKMIKASANGGAWIMMPGLIIYSDPGKYLLEAKKDSDPKGMLIAILTGAKPCEPFQMNVNAQFYVPDFICGPSEFHLASDLSLREFTFEASGLPVPVTIHPFGQCVLQRYHTEIEFTRVMLPGEKAPFLVPQKVIATLETNKGKVVIASEYQPKRAGVK